MSEVENQELKGGHAPAVKVGGVRVVQHKPAKPDKTPTAKPTEEEIAEFGEDGKEKKDGEVIVSGAVTDVAQAFPKEAVKAFHEKPVPTHQMATSPKPKIIQQPKK